MYLTCNHPQMVGLWHNGIGFSHFLYIFLAWDSNGIFRGLSWDLCWVNVFVFFFASPLNWWEMNWWEIRVNPPSLIFIDLLTVKSPRESSLGPVLTALDEAAEGRDGFGLPAIRARWDRAWSAWAGRGWRGPLHGYWWQQRISYLGLASKNTVTVCCGTH